MKISLSESPNMLGIRMGAELDLSTLDDNEAEKVRKLVEPVVSVQSKEPAAAPGADVRSVVIAVDHDGKHTERRFPEADVPPEVAPLLHYLRTQAKVMKPNK
ncbi:protealysin inhibitor emfourin [Sinorhizobium meliloti]|uniref:protealysin inhibitor emfourin n=1 Tax=Rhizobium meliloti TaxID=382 RepID=UPI0030CDCFAC